jgi:hypothetical protein
MVVEETYVSADAEARRLAERIRQSGMQPAYALFEKGLAEFEAQGGDVADILPESATAKLGLAAGETGPPDGRTFWSVYGEVVCEQICGGDSELRERVRGALSSAGSGLVATLLGMLGLPIAALGIVVPIAGILTALGLDAFCRWRESAGVPTVAPE